MKKLALAGAALLAMSTASQAAFIENLGNNPNSATGRFSNTVNGTTFQDDYTFNLINGEQFVTFASATNDFITAGDANYITNFTGQLLSFGQDMLYGTADDFAVNPVATAHPCTDNPGNCQELSGSATLAMGGYYLRLEGTGGGTAGYGGDLTTAVTAVPEPSTWAMMILGFVGIAGMAGRKQWKGFRLA